MKDRIVWEDFYGRRLTMKGIEDTHLVNIINFMRKHRSDMNILLFLEEAERRKLSPKMFQVGEIPHRNPETNQWMLWDEKENKPMPVGR
jgi:hypothetical protein